jgi:ABC-type nitrate/sulfonate/bicarbonate transport system ATPase subunit
VTGFIQTSYQEQLLAQLLESHLVGDFCIIGPRGCGKSATVNRLAALLNYQIEPVVLCQVGTLLNTNISVQFYFQGFLLLSLWMPPVIRSLIFLLLTCLQSGRPHL